MSLNFCRLAETTIEVASDQHSRRFAQTRATRKSLCVFKVGGVTKSPVNLLLPHYVLRLNVSPLTCSTRHSAFERRSHSCVSLKVNGSAQTVALQESKRVLPTFTMEL